MVNAWIKRFTIAMTIFLLSGAANANLFTSSRLNSAVNPTFLPVDTAFSYYGEQKEGQIELNWQVHSDYYLYRDQIKITVEHAQLGSYTIPRGEWREDEFFGRVETLEGFVILQIPLKYAKMGAQLVVVYQGCAKAGFCYSPETRTLSLTPWHEENAERTENGTTEASEKEISFSESLPVKENSTSPKRLPFSPWLALLIGIGIAFTPCVVPMYPLIMAFLFGNETVKPARRFVLTFSYIQGMALTYTLLGFGVVLLGLQFQAFLQNPYLLIALSLLILFFALSLFGFYTVQLPSKIQTWLSMLSSQQKSGSVAGVFVMGALAGLIGSPCTTAPLAAILSYIAGSGNLFYGGGILYLYALGMGLPLLAVVLFGQKLLPKSGVISQQVKTFLGFVMLIVPIILLERILGEAWQTALLSLLATMIALWLFIQWRDYPGRGRTPLQIVALLSALVAVTPLQSLLWKQWGSSSNLLEQKEITALPFVQISSEAELQQILQQAGSQRVMLDFYADWCVACKQYEKYTFSDQLVRDALSDMVVLQADVTANSALQRDLLASHQILGLPSILFFHNGKELPESRISGFLKADDFLQHLPNLNDEQNRPTS